MPKYRTVGRIISGAAGPDRKVIQPNTEVDNLADLGLSEEEVAQLLKSGALREVAEEPAPADGPTPAAPPATDAAAASAESDVISRDAPPSGAAG